MRHLGGFNQAPIATQSSPEFLEFLGFQRLNQSRNQDVSNSFQVPEDSASELIGDVQDAFVVVDDVSVLDQVPQSALVSPSFLDPLAEAQKTLERRKEHLIFDLRPPSRTGSS